MVGFPCPGEGRDKIPTQENGGVDHVLGGVMKDPELNERKTMITQCDYQRSVIFLLYPYISQRRDPNFPDTVSYPIAPSAYPYTPLAVSKLIPA